MGKQRLLGGWVVKRAVQVLLLYLGKYNPGFLNLTKPDPFDVDIKVTERCDSRCITCDVWKSEFKSGLGKELTTREIEDIFHQLKGMGVQTVGFTGGEPLLREDIGELIKKAKEIVGAKVYVVTNGSLLEKRAKLLVESGADYVSVSIDGIGKTDEEVRGSPGHYDRAIRGIRALKKLTQNGEAKVCRCTIGTTLLKSNITEVSRLIELCEELDVNWYFNLLDTNLYYFRNVDDSPLLLDDDELVDKTFDYLATVREERPDVFNLDYTSLAFARNYLKGKKLYPHCYLGYLRVYIDSQLNVYSGCWALKPVGNLREKKLKEIISSDQYRQRARAMFDLKCPGCTCGYVINFAIEKLPSAAKYVLFNNKSYRKYL